MRGMRGIPKRWSHAVLSLATWPCAALCRPMHCQLRKTGWEHYYLWNCAHKTNYFSITLLDSSVKFSFLIDNISSKWLRDGATISLCNVGNQASHLNQICCFKFVPPPFFGCIGKNTLLYPRGCTQIWCIAVLVYPLHCTLLEGRQWQNAVCADYHAPSFSLKWPCADAVQHVPDLQLQRHILARMACVIPVQYLL